MLDADLIEPEDDDPCGRLAVEQQQAAADPGWQFDCSIVNQVPGLPETRVVVDRPGAGPRGGAYDRDAGREADSVKPVDEPAGRDDAAGRARRQRGFDGGR